MTSRCLLIVLLLTVSFSVTCRTSKEVVEVSPSSTPSPSPVPTEHPETRVAREESRSQNNDYYDTLAFDSSRPAVRAAARQFVITELPKWTLKGMASQSYQSNVFWVDVDLENGQHKRVLSLIVKQFFPDGGAPYWKAFPLDKSHASQLHDAHDSVVEAELDQYRNP